MPMTNAPMKPVMTERPCPVPQLRTEEMPNAEDSSRAIAGNLRATLDQLGAALDALMPGSAPGYADTAADGLLGHLDYCRQLADSTAQYAHMIAEMVGAYHE